LLSLAEEVRSFVKVGRRSTCAVPKKYFVVLFGQNKRVKLFPKAAVVFVSLYAPSNHGVLQPPRPKAARSAVFGLKTVNFVASVAYTR
jgi:hypothetical protein